MANLYLAPTPVTPEVRLNPTQGILSIRGESYPENVLAFYSPVLQSVQSALDEAGLRALKVEMHITYYNSASAKAIHRLFQMLNKAAEKGCAIKLLWHYDEEDDMARDLGNDIHEDFPSIDVVHLPVNAA
jgi:hypothetical protein